MVDLGLGEIHFLLVLEGPFGPKMEKVLERCDGPSVEIFKKCLLAFAEELDNLAVQSQDSVILSYFFSVLLAFY